MRVSDTAIGTYLQDVLGVSPAIRVWAGEADLPYFLRDAFRFRELDLLGHRIVFAIDQRSGRPSLREVCTHISKVRRIADTPVVYVTSALASYERRRLIEQNVQFLVPSNQLYLPGLGIDLREHFRQCSLPPERQLSPATQAILISALLHDPWLAEWQASEVADRLGYSPMTVSRAVKELTSAGMAGSFRVGRTNWLRMDALPRAVWQQAKPKMRSPVKRSLWLPAMQVAHDPIPLPAGMSALAKSALLADPDWPVYAVSQEYWKQVNLTSLPEPEAGGAEWQVWTYPPGLVPGATTVDPLSLILSLLDDTDERVKQALDDVERQLPW